MLKIKLARFGKKNQPHYRVIVSEARSKRDSGYVANIGSYAPTQTPKILNINMEAYTMWLSKGAQPTDTVAGLVKRLESGTPFPVKEKRPSRKARAKQIEAENTAKEAKAAEATAKEAEVEAPATEVETTPVTE